MSIEEEEEISHLHFNQMIQTRRQRLYLEGSVTFVEVFIE